MMRYTLIISILLTSMLPASNIATQQETDCKCFTEENCLSKDSFKEINNKKESTLYNVSKMLLLNTTTSRPELLY